MSKINSSVRTFPPFSLSRLLKTCFAPRRGEKLAVLIDLEDPNNVKDFGFLKRRDLTIQRHAHDVFYRGLLDGVMRELDLGTVDFFAYRQTGGSNLDLDDLAVDPAGRQLSFERDIYPRYNILLCISTYSATAPLTALAKRFGFRGATMHGMNDLILKTGLAVDYNEVSQDAEKLRLGMTRADWAEIEFLCHDRRHVLRLDLSQQEAQKSHGLCRGEKPDIANLPAGEIYFVPTGAEGEFPMKFSQDGTLGLMHVSGGFVRDASLISGNPATIEAHRQKLREDPVTGQIGELGFGTQELPVAGRDIQDEKILGTFHLATGRSDHLGGPLTPEKFKIPAHATHDDILFAPHKTPEIEVPQVRLRRDGQTHVLLENYQTAPYLRGLLR